jgi:hypothetical protein
VPIRFAAALGAALLALSGPLSPAVSASPKTPIRPFLIARDRTITVALASDRGSKFTIDASATTLSLASVDRGGSVVRLSATTRGLVVGTAPPAGSPLVELTPDTPVAALTFSLPASLRAGMYDVKVVNARDSQLTFEEVVPSQLYVSTAPDHPDSGLLEVRREYLGKDVFLMAATQWHSPMGCRREPPTPMPQAASPVPSPQASGTVSPSEFMRRMRAFATKPVQTDDFVQVGALRGSAWRVLSVNRLTSAEDGYFSNIDMDFVGIEPLELQFAPLSADARADDPTCKTVVRVFADPWEVRRALFTRSPFDHPEWPKRIQAAVRSGTVLAGMTHEMAANVVGYPSVYGSIRDLDNMQRWDYDEPAPFGPTITFRGDRVVTYDPGSAPP